MQEGLSVRRSSARTAQVGPSSVARPSRGSGFPDRRPGTDLDLDEIAPTQLAVDGKIEERTIAQAPLPFEEEADRPYLPRFQRAFRANPLAGVPCATIGGGRVVVSMFHFVSPSTGHDWPQEKRVGTGWPGPSIGIGGRLAAPPLPHHRAYGSVPRRFDRVKLGRGHRVEEDRGTRSSGCAGPVGPPGVLTCARTPSANRRQPRRGTLSRHGGAVP